MAITDPYVAYCVDEACAYIAEQMERKRIPKLPTGKSTAKQRDGWTTNADLIEAILKETKQV